MGGDPLSLISGSFKYWLKITMIGGKKREGGREMNVLGWT